MWGSDYDFTNYKFRKYHMAFHVCKQNNTKNKETLRTKEHNKQITLARGLKFKVELC